MYITDLLCVLKNEATMDTGFFEKLQALQAGGSLNKDDLNALLQEYLDQAGPKKRNRKQRQEEMVSCY